MKDIKNVFKEAGVILILLALILSSTAVIGENANKQTQIETCLSEVSQSNNNMINQELTTSRKVILWDNGPPDNRTCISCYYAPSDSGTIDRLVIDDFIVPEPGWVVNDGHFLITTGTPLPGTPPPTIYGVNVYFFGSNGHCFPMTKPFALRNATFTTTLTGDYIFGMPVTAVDCQFAPVTLTPGEWWVCFQPVMDKANFSLWLTAAVNGCSVFVDFPDIGHPRWTWGYDVFYDEYDVAWYITYDEPEPAICCDSINMSWNEIPPGSFIDNGEFYVWNCGDSGTTLNWTVKKWPTWGEEWTFNPIKGAEPYGGAGTYVSFSFKAPPTQNRKFTGKIKVINSDKPTEFCELEIIVKTPKNRGIYFNFFENLIKYFPILRHILA